MGQMRNEHTSKAVASKASRILRNPKSSTVAKSVAASALTQAPNKPNKWAIKIVASEASKIRDSLGNDAGRIRRKF